MTTEEIIMPDTPETLRKRARASVQAGLKAESSKAKQTLFDAARMLEKDAKKLRNAPKASPARKPKRV
jgi:hypothetical protein